MNDAIEPSPRVSKARVRERGERTAARVVIRQTGSSNTRRGPLRRVPVLIQLVVLGLSMLGRSLVALPAAELPFTPLPAGASGLIRDSSANFWAVGAPAVDGCRPLLVLPAQAPSAWTEPHLAGLPRAAWQAISPQRDRGIIVDDGQRAFRFDPRTPEVGVVACSLATARAQAAVTPWRMAARMPASNHDLTAAVLDRRLFIAGGVTSDFGFPATTRAFDVLAELNPQEWTWRAAARFSRPRIYCATAAFAGRVWIVGGDELSADGQRRATTLVETYDPRTGVLARAPDLPAAWPAPLALAAGGRLWVMGVRERTERGQMVSIGPEDTAWRVEPAAFPQMGALAGAALDDLLYVCVPGTGLAVFDPSSKQWRVLPGPTQPRSAQVASWRGELWIVGGCDIADWSETRIYNPAERTWRRGPALPEPLAWGAAAVVADQLVVTGGAAPYGPAQARTYAFSDRTYVLPASAIPPVAPVAPAGPLPRWSDAKLRDTGEVGLPFTSTPVYPHFKFNRLSSILRVPSAEPAGPERMLVTEVEGSAWTFLSEGEGTAPERLFDLPSHFKQSTHTYAVAFHPRFPAVPHIFVLYNRVQPKPAENFIARLTVTLGASPVVDMGSEQILLQWPSDGHNGGDLRFGPEGYLYASIGDRSQPGDLNNLGQRVDIISGGVLRLDVDHPAPGQNYAVPVDNPFVGQPDVRPEFWSYGLRNPWRLFVAPNGDVWTGDNGDDSWETIHLIRKGQNSGWSVYEGSHPFKRNRVLAGPTPNLTPPVIELSHAEARSMVGGLVYSGTKHPSLLGHYVFGDYVTGSVWAFQWDGAAAQNFRRIADTRGQILSFGTDRAGEILMTRNDGQIHRLDPAPPPQVAKAKFPELLSATGIYASTAQNAPAPGVVPYAVNAGAWSDGARAHRWLAVAGWQAIKVDSVGEGRWSLPDGSAVARTLEVSTSLGPRRVETQLMYREHGAWRFYTYAWNEAQTDAELIPEAGEERAVPAQPPRRWRFSSRGECAVCHTSQTDFTIALTTAQLNRDGDLSALGRRVENQIAALVEVGMIKLEAAAPAEPWPRKTAPADVFQPVAARARAYLDINCAHCHRTNGVGGRAAFQLTEAIPLARAGLINGQPLVPLLGGDSKIITPGLPERSEIIHRLSIAEGGRMPMLGAQQKDLEGVDLIRRWIQEMP